MRRLATGVMMAAALAFTAGTGTLHARADGTSVTIAGAPPGAAFELALNGGKVATATADSQGTIEAVLDLANLGKVEVQVYVVQCEDGRNVVHLVSAGNGAPPEDQKCKRRMLGAFLLKKGTKVTIDLASGTVDASGGSAMTTRLLLIGGGAAAVGAGIAAGGGSSSSPTSNLPASSAPSTPSTPTPSPAPTPSPTPAPTPTIDPIGTWDVLTSVISGQIHESFVDLGKQFQQAWSAFAGLQAASSTTVRVTGSSGSNWVAVTGNVDTGTGTFSMTGSGTVAGFPNVSVRFEGTVTKDGALNATYTMGAGGELPQGIPIVYSVQGQKR